MRKYVVAISLLATLLLVVAALGLKGFITAGQTPEPATSESKIGRLGSEHSHMSMLVFIRGELFDFTVKDYQLKSPVVHFEDDDGTTIHKHATGITLPDLFVSLGMKLDTNCLEMPGSKYCTEGGERLQIFVNRVPFNDKIVGYELRPGDKILINYGNASNTDIQLKLNSIPTLPSDL